MGISKIWIYGESTGGVVSTATLELLAKARTIGDTVEVVVHGDASAVAAELGEHGASTVLS
ncbi:MAG: electron transfer flavoprotein subunit alpha/FixB family protein, partial [Acidimicrobiales bacterium]|nr:electron transfer flavoprotein subunit alpha/FixB family protein [Acidimicrobiales bacterium]